MHKRGTRCKSRVNMTVPPLQIHLLPCYFGVANPQIYSVCRSGKCNTKFIFCNAYPSNVQYMGNMEERFELFHSAYTLLATPLATMERKSSVEKVSHRVIRVSFRNRVCVSVKIDFNRFGLSRRSASPLTNPSSVGWKDEKCVYCLK